MDISNKTIERHLNNNLKKIIAEGRQVLKPAKQITVSEWADNNRMLPETSAEPGRWRTDRVPHLREIMNAVNDSAVRQITVMGSAQIGKTEFINNVIGYKIDNDPCAMMVMQPTKGDARDYAQQKLEPMLEDTRVLREKVAKKLSRNADNSMFRKKFIGGWLLIVSGESPSATRSRSAKLTIGDDIDGIPITFKREGDPILRLIKRSTTYTDSLNINISTPTRDGESRIQALMEQSTYERYYVKCTECGAEQLLEEENLVWQKERDIFGKVLKHYPETARYKCAGCGAEHDEHNRIEMLRRGEWKAERKYIKGHRGFWINELSSTLSTIVKVVRQIIDSGVDIEGGEILLKDAIDDKVEALYNTVFGRAYVPLKGEEIEAIAIMERVEEYIDKNNTRIPNEILLLTASVDVQGGSGKQEQRLEVNVWGWGKGEEGWIIFRQRIPGNIRDLTGEHSPWQTLDKILNMKFIRKDGIELPIMVKAIDSGYESISVYDYVTPRQRYGVYAIKGAQKYGADLLPRRASMVNKGRTKLIIIGTQAAKAELYGRLKNVTTAGAKCLHFTKIFCDAEYFKQLTAEHGVRKRSGILEYVFYEKKKKSMANEAIDLLVYAYTIMKLINPNWEQLERSLSREVIKIDVPETDITDASREQRKTFVVKRKTNFATTY